ncbi:MAG: VOC family protein [Clostridia bacterium]
MIQGFAHIGLFIRDIEISKAFYCEKLGFCVVSETENLDGTKISMVQNGDCMVELVQLPGYDGYTDGFVNHFAMKVANMSEAKAELEAKGIQFEMEQPVRSNVFNGINFLMFRGPDGEHLEIDELL